MRVLRRLAALGLGLIAALALLVVGSMTLSPRCADIAPDGSFDVAIILGGGIEPWGELGTGSAGRAMAGASLHDRGVVDRVLMTGAAARGRISAAEAMAMLAEGRGVPASALLVEPASHSTLENALFSLDLLGSDSRILLVTEGFHLWRGWASFAWAGHPPEGICQSSPLADPSEGGWQAPLREIGAWGVNLVRAPAWSAGRALGLEMPEGFLE